MGTHSQLSKDTNKYNELIFKKKDNGNGHEFRKIIIYRNGLVFQYFANC